MTEPEPTTHPAAAEPSDGPLDAANQSLSDALRSSFSVLKGIMVVLVILYLVSNIRGVGDHEQALKLRLGRLLPGVYDAGLVWAFPFPIEEIVPLPTRKSNQLLIDSHTFFHRDNEKGKALALIHRGSGVGLNPVLDGAILTADAGLVHTQWKITYKFDQLESFVSRIAGDRVEAAEDLIRTFTETAGIEIGTELTAEEFIRTRVEYVQSEMKRRINRRLTAIQAGVVVGLVEMFEPTPPIQIRQSFDNTQRAESGKQQAIRAAQKEETRILSDAAGAAHHRLVPLLKRIDAGALDNASLAALRAKADRILLTEAEGEAGRRLKEAGTYRSQVVSRIQSDVDRYRTLLPEYRRNPLMLINRLWEQTRQQIFSSPGVTKFSRPAGLKEIRILITLDPLDVRAGEAERLQQKEFDASELRPTKLVPIGPEYD